MCAYDLKRRLRLWCGIVDALWLYSVFIEYCFRYVASFKQTRLRVCLCFSYLRPCLLEFATFEERFA